MPIDEPCQASIPEVPLLLCVPFIDAEDVVLWQVRAEIDLVSSVPELIAVLGGSLGAYGDLGVQVASPFAPLQAWVLQMVPPVLDLLPFQASPADRFDVSPVGAMDQELRHGLWLLAERWPIHVKHGVPTPGGDVDLMVLRLSLIHI